MAKSIIEKQTSGLHGIRGARRSVGNEIVVDTDVYLEGQHSLNSLSATYRTLKNLYHSRTSMVGQTPDPKDALDTAEKAAILSAMDAVQIAIRMREKRFHAEAALKAEDESITSDFLAEEAIEGAPVSASAPLA